ncbi:hypothetical protein MMC14_009269 [Varicellaria rhodocarpa]|nr:hypothetical protein [Varicellaria rhodocarpa]
MASPESKIIKKEDIWTVNGSPRESVTLLSDHRPPNIPGKALITLLVSLPPNSKTPPHTHNGAAVTALILRGATLNQMNCDEPFISREGDTFYEAPGCHHVRGENASVVPGEVSTFYAVFVIDEEVIERQGYGGLVILDVDAEKREAGVGSRV